MRRRHLGRVIALASTDLRQERRKCKDLVDAYLSPDAIGLGIGCEVRVLRISDTELNDTR
jgi:hypothetical protein